MDVTNNMTLPEVYDIHLYGQEQRPAHMYLFILTKTRKKRQVYFLPVECNELKRK